MAEPALVSIVIPSYKTTWFEAALKSALDQDYPHCEIIVSDDCPTLFIRDVVSRYQPTAVHPLRYIRNVPALGEGANTEQCIIESRGEYVKFLFDDDVLAPDCVSELVKAMSVSPAVVMATSRRNRIDAVGELLNSVPTHSPPVSVDSVMNGQDIINFMVGCISNFIGEPSCVLMRRQDLLEIVASEDSLYCLNGEMMYFLGDLTLYLKILRKGDLAYLMAPLSSFRITDEQVSQMGRDKDQRAGNSHLKLPQHLLTLGWAKPDELFKGKVRVAPFSDLHKLHWVDISAALMRSFAASEFFSWLEAHKLTPAQQLLIDQCHAANPVTVKVVAVINALGCKPSAVEQTLSSILQQPRTGLEIAPVVLSDEPLTLAETTLQVTQSDHFFSDVNAVIENHAGDWFIFLQAGDRFTSSGLTALAAALPQIGDLLAVYGDEVTMSGSAPTACLSRPDFNLDLFLSSPATMAHHWLFRRDLLQAAGGLEEGCGNAAELALILKLIESTGFALIGHLPEPLLLTSSKEGDAVQEMTVIQRHIHQRGFPDAEISCDDNGHYRVHYHHQHKPQVSIVILAGAHLPSLIGCLTSVMERTRYPHYELIIVADNQSSPARDGWLSEISRLEGSGIKVCAFPETFQRSGMSNLAVASASGEYLLYLHAELAISDEYWLDNLLNHALRPEVGIVGGRQLTPSGRVHHAGYVLGLNGLAGEVFKGAVEQQVTMMNRLRLEQNYSAVSGDFMLVRKEALLAVDGFDTSLHRYDDIDFCLRIREQGYLTVWTPHARILRSSAEASQPENAAQLSVEKDILYRRWQPLIARDPAYNSSLSFKSKTFELEAHSLICWKPLAGIAIPTVFAVIGEKKDKAGWQIREGLNALQQQGIVSGMSLAELPDLARVAQYQPDSIILQHQTTVAFQTWAAELPRIDKLFKVYWLDQNVPSLGLKNHYRHELKNEAVSQLQNSVSRMDRLIVSSAGLAEALEGIHSDIVVLPTRLSDSWRGLHTYRQRGQKPRVGWSGSAEDFSDLSVIADLIREYADKVEWIILGACPDSLQRYVSEIHAPGVPELSAQRLAALNLDLALVPAEEGFATSCKNPLKLLEYGACAIPVICSDVRGFPSALPTTRVRNRFKDWRDALRMHLNDPVASERLGRELQVVVEQDWMLTGSELSLFAQIWLP
ncbi:glycosyltransferase [Erwinia amylovora]